MRASTSSSCSRFVVCVRVCGPHCLRFVALQSALLADNAKIPRKTAKKLDVTAFAHKLKQRLMGVRGRFAPDSAAGTAVLTADAEAGVAPGTMRELDDGDLVVVAEEPPLVIEQPKAPAAHGQHTLEGIFSNRPLTHVGELTRDETAVWVAQLPAFAGLNLWDPALSVTVPQQQQQQQREDEWSDIDRDEPIEEDVKDSPSGEEDGRLAVRIAFIISFRGP